MKKILIATFLFGLLFMPAASLLAQEEVPRYLDICCDEGSVMDTIVDWMFTILLVVAALFIIIAAFYFITASGNPETVSKARNFVLYALIGVAVAIMARGLVAMIRTIIGT